MIKKVVFSALALVLSLLLLLGCGMAAPAPGQIMERTEEMPLGLVPAPAPEAPAVAEEQVAYGGAQDNVSERMIVRTASLSLVVEDTEESLEAIEALAAELDGYISELSTWRANEELAATITLRVPAQSFDQARERIKALGLETENENVSGQDVTEEYIDLEARLHNLEVTEGELLELLASAQETHRDAESILAIYREISNVRQQIEQIQGRMQYLENASALATLTVNLTMREEEEPVVQAGWEPLRHARDALRTLVNALKLLVDLFIWVALFFLPLLAILALPFILSWLGWRLWRRRRRRSRES